MRFLLKLFHGGTTTAIEGSACVQTPEVNDGYQQLECKHAHAGIA